jgi:hypothetical protein
MPSRQILTIAKITQCGVIYTDDIGLAALARAEGIKTVGIAVLPLPPEDAQLPLPWSLPQNDETPSPPDQKDAFVDAAKAAGADTDEKRWEARLKAVAKPPPKAAKKGK